MADGGFGRRVRQVRETQLRMSQEDLADAAGISREWVSKIERAGGKVSLEYAMFVYTALTQRLPGLSFEWLLKGSGGMFVGSVRTSRRGFLQQGARLLPAALIPMIPDVERWVAPSLDLPLLADLQCLTENLARLRPSLPPAELLPQVESHLLTLGTRVALRSGPPELRGRLLSVTGGTAALAGWVSLMLEHRREARDFLDWAEPLVREAGDDDALSLIQTLRADIASSVPIGGLGGSPGRALEYLEHARALTSDDPPPALSVWYRLRSAEELASLGRADEALALLEEAERLDSMPDGRSYYLRPTWGQWGRGSGGHLAGFRGNILRLANRPRDAIKVLSTMQDSGYAADTPVRMVDLAAAHAQAQEPDQACALLTQAMDLLANHDLPIAAQRIAGIRQRELRPWDSDPMVRGLDERLLATL